MDYLAFILFGIGLLLVITGLLLQYREPPSVLGDKKIGFSGSVPEVNNSMREPVVATTTYAQSQTGAAERKSEAAVAVKIAGENPKLFQKEGYLYFDQSGKNRYDGNTSHFNMESAGRIRRLGRGIFSYDGFSFHFDHDAGRQNFPLEALEQIAFYPNCIVLVPKENLPAALLFLDETESIRKMLETFRTDDGN